MSPVTVRQLTEQHRRTQLGLTARTVQRLDDLWILWDPDDPATVARWLDAALLVIGDAHASHAALARNYYRRARLTALGAAGAGTLPTPGLSIEAARTALVATGPAGYASARARGVTADRAYRSARVNSARAGARQATMASRDTVTTAVAGDRRARGWVRVTSGNACDFCVMQANRGAVYSAGTVDFSAHANCGCQPMPAFE